MAGGGVGSRWGLRESGPSVLVLVAAPTTDACMFFYGSEAGLQQAIIYICSVPFFLLEISFLSLLLSVFFFFFFLVRLVSSPLLRRVQIAVVWRGVRLCVYVVRMFFCCFRRPCYFSCRHGPLSEVKSLRACLHVLCVLVFFFFFYVQLVVLLWPTYMCVCVVGSGTALGNKSNHVGIALSRAVWP